MVKKLNIMVLFVLIALSTGIADETKIFNVIIKYDKFKSSEWSFYNHIYDPVESKGMIIFKRAPLLTKNNVSVTVDFSIEYEILLPGTTDVIQYSTLKRSTIGSHSVKKSFLSKDGHLKHGVGFEIENEISGCKLRIILVYMIFDNIGFQITGTFTSDVFNKIKEDVYEVIKSIDFEVDSRSINVDTLMSIGQMYTEKANLEKALETYNNVLQYDSTISEAYYERGIILWKILLFKESLKDFNSAIKLNTKNADYYSFRALVYTALGDYPNAVSDYLTAIVLQPDNASYYYNLGSFYHVNKKYKEAIMRYSQAIEKQPDARMFYFQRALVYFLQEERSKGMEDLSKFVALLDSDTAESEERAFYEIILKEYYYIVGEYKFEIGEREDAKYYLLKAMSLGSEEAYEILKEY